MTLPKILLVLGGLASTPAWAQLAVGSCSATATAIPFGAYDPTSSTPLTPTGSVSVSCHLISGVSLAVLYTITLTTGASGSYLNRKMTGTSTPMYYNLYLNSGLTQVWGDGVSGGSVSKTDGYLLGVGTVTLSYTVYSKVPAQQLVAAGSYLDSIIVQVAY